MKRRTLFVSFATLGLMFFSSNGLSASIDTGVINQTTQQTYSTDELQLAIDEASSGDVLDLSGVFTGSFKIYNKSLTLQVPDGGSAVLEGNGLDRVLEIIGLSRSDPSTVNLKQLTIQNGWAQRGSHNGPNGGGVLAVYTTLNIDNATLEYNRADCGGAVALCYATAYIGGSTIVGNTAATGGGINVLASNAVIDNSLIASNSGTQGGGAGILSNFSILTLQNGTAIESNSSTGSNSVGGGLYNSLGSTTTCNEVSFVGNESQESGGAIYNSEALEVINSFLSENSSESNGGAIYNTTGLYPESQLQIETSELSNNTSAASGGGIYNGSSGRLTTSDTNIQNNSCASYGGGLFNGGALLGGSSGAVAKLTGGNISGNEAGLEGGGIFSGRQAVLKYQNVSFEGGNSPNDVYTK